MGLLFLLFEVIRIDSIAENCQKDERYKVSEHLLEGNSGNGDVWLGTNHHQKWYCYAEEDPDLFAYFAGIIGHYTLLLKNAALNRSCC